MKGYIRSQSILWSLALTGMSSLVGCKQGTSSDVLVTTVDHTEVKRQTIGNCWLYAHASWLESLWLSTYNEKVDISESYWTWWDWYQKLLAENRPEIETGGTWKLSADIIIQHGWILESDFSQHPLDPKIPPKDQAQALAYINKQLMKNGTLAEKANRTPENVRQELDKAFNITMAKTETLARNASTTKVTTGKNKSSVTVEEALSGSTEQKWQQVAFPTSEDARAAFLKRVKSALNDHHPVVVTLFVEWNALDPADGTFKYSLLAKAKESNGGGHMVVLSDYTAKNVPEVGYIGEGNVSDELKEKAMLGEVGIFKAKNSWGTNRPNRGLTDGYTRFEYDYLKQHDKFWDVMLPPGY